MRRLLRLLAFVGCAAPGISGVAGEPTLRYERTDPPLEVTFAIAGGHYSGVVTGGNLFLQADIASAPVVRWEQAAPQKFYTLLMLDFDGNANGSWPDPVAAGENSPVRHWIVGNIPGTVLAGGGYVESSLEPKDGIPTVLQPYRAPHIPVVSDRYGLYVFEQPKRIDFAAVEGPITNYDFAAFLRTYELAAPVASNFFVALYTSVSPFSGKAFHGNDVAKTWHKDSGNVQSAPLVPEKN